MARSEQIEEFLSSLQAHKGFSGNTLAAYRNDLNQFSEFVRSGGAGSAASADNWSTISRDAIISFLLFLRERRYAQTTVARKQAAIKSFFKFLVSKGALPSSPIEDLASPHVDRILPRTITTSDADRLLAEVERSGRGPEALRDRAMLLLLYSTGLRVGEMVSLDVSAADTEAGTINLDVRGRVRQVAIGTYAGIDALRRYLEDARPALARNAGGGASLAQEGQGERALFLNHRGQRLTRQGFWLILKRYARLSGLGEVTPHTLRHSFAAQKLQSGGDVKDLQQILGHANISTTQVYARLKQNGKHQE